MKRNIKVLLSFSMILIFLLSGCGKKAAKPVSDNFKEMILKDSNYLVEEKGKGEVYKDDEGNLVSISYSEEHFGVKKVDTTFYFFDDEDKIAGVTLDFPNETKYEDLKKNIESKIGKVKSEEVDEVTETTYAEWVDEDNTYYNLLSGSQGTTMIIITIPED